MRNVMSIESILCAQLYSDMADATFGLYENIDSYLPYALFAVSFDKDKMWVFSSKTYEKLGNTVDAKAFLSENGGMDLLRQATPRHTPCIAHFDLPISDGVVTQEYLKGFLAKQLPITLEYYFCWQIVKNHVYVVLYLEKPLKQVPELVQSATESVAIIWRDYFAAKTINLDAPRHDINTVIEDIFGNKQDQDQRIIEYFPTLTRISSLYYESGRSKGCIAITAEKNMSPLVLINPKNDPLSFTQENGKQLRKLLEIAKGDLSLLVYNGSVYGIGVPDNPLFTFTVTGHMEWHLNRCVDKNEDQMLRFKHGNYFLPQDAELRDWYIDSRTECFGEDTREIVHALLSDDNIKAYSHGALFIIICHDKAKDEVSRLCDKKRGIYTEDIDLIANINKAGALCAIDGALLMDDKGHCYGLGIILDGEAKVDGTPARGSRFNSTKTYISRCCENKIEACAVIVSQDGYIDILTTYDAECKPMDKGEVRGIV